ncbi:hypothetical protein FA95DRAFT_545691 [Auriscalpium vulgare]|uniref:Uncharacterized protein n=1 Tax=Auriscalpium vulgare TaxID=40419 RepID=A0ACB8RG88_9AGAM|nr:hypothetical protein FA95DRAFT_545691 [Auriscalpium vulgare]
MTGPRSGEQIQRDTYLANEVRGYNPSEGLVGEGLSCSIDCTYTRARIVYSGWSSIDDKGGQRTWFIALSERASRRRHSPRTCACRFCYIGFSHHLRRACVIEGLCMRIHALVVTSRSPVQSPSVNQRALYCCIRQSFPVCSQGASTSYAVTVV